MTDYTGRRRRMVDRDLRGRGIRDARVLSAMEAVPREAFVEPGMEEFAYDDSPLPIAAGQTISQPYIVARMIQALGLRGGERVLDIGTGSGYAAAVLGRIADQVYSVERHQELVDLARTRFETLGYDNIHVRHGDGTLGWAEHAPYDAIVVAAGGPEVPRALLDQLVPGGRLVIPVGETLRDQRLVRVVPTDEGPRAETLEAVRFVPLVGERGWRESDLDAAFGDRPVRPPAGAAGTREGAVQLLRETAEPLSGIEDAELGGLLERVGGARLVLLGEATHGTSEFYRMRARITRELIERHGFDTVAVEADWPDAARIDRYVRDMPASEASEAADPAFARFPTWMWRNREVAEFVEWLRAHNLERPAAERVSFRGLDLYSLFRSIDAVLAYLDRVDPASARVARGRYACLSPWERDPAVYGRAVLTRAYRTCEREVVEILRELLDRRLDYMAADGERFLDALQNARLVANAERYYRTMYYGSQESWNLRDSHMFDTLSTLLTFRGERSRAIVWAHNSHLGNAAATEMGWGGEHNVGQLAREAYGEYAFLVGFGTDHGRVAAATDWGGPLELKQIRPARADSYEGWFHEGGHEACLLHLRNPVRPEVRGELEGPLLERAIGVVYRPETELQSHYFRATLPAQFDEYIWFDGTTPVEPLPARVRPGVPDTYPFGL